YSTGLPSKRESFAGGGSNRSGSGGGLRLGSFFQNALNAPSGAEHPSVAMRTAPSQRTANPVPRMGSLPASDGIGLSPDLGPRPIPAAPPGSRPMPVVVYLAVRAWSKRRPTAFQLTTFHQAST